MKVLPFKIPKPENELVRHQVDDVTQFYDKFHQHPEVQLTVLFQGVGNLIVGDYIGRFKPGELYLLSPNIPHVFRNDKMNSSGDPEGDRVYSQSIFYDVKIFATKLSNIAEFDRVHDFFENLNGCYRVLDKQDFITSRILKLRDIRGLERVIVSLEVLLYIMSEPVLERLNKTALLIHYSKKEGKRMDKVVRFLMDESHRKITLSEVAEVASMNKEAFCRFFRERTRKTFTEFLNEIRIKKACELLGNSDLTIHQVAVESGFSNLSYFNRVFRKVNGTTPKEYRSTLSMPTY